MATVYGPYSAGWKPSGANEYRHYRAFLEYSVSTTATTVTISAYMGFNLDYTVTKSPYNCQLRIGSNTWTGAGSSTYGDAHSYIVIGTHSVSYTRGSSAYTVNVYGDVQCSTSGGKGGWTGAWSTAGVSVTVPARTYSVTYNANGGTNAPAAQNKVHGVNLTLSSAIPLKASCDFVKWNTQQDGSGTDYLSGATYSDNAALSLYAQWHDSFQPPSVNDLRAYRVANGSTGVDPNVKGDGTKCYVDFNYAEPVSGGTPTITATFGSSSPVAISGTGNTRYAYSEDDHLPVTSTETVTITIAGTDYQGNAYSFTHSTFISTENYVFDAFKGTSGSEEYEAFALGGMARDFDSPTSDRHTGGNFDCYMSPTFFKMIGEIKMWAGNTIPEGWLLCDGSEVSKTEYPRLFEAIGSLWGTPSSSSNFLLPNLKGRVPVGYDANDSDATYNFNLVGYQSTSTNGELMTAVSGYPTHTDYSTGSSGGNGYHNNMPPYAVIKYIICAR